MTQELPQWPDWMPVPMLSGYGVEIIDRSVSTEMEIGTIKRVQFDSDETHIPVTIFLDALQRTWFQTWERDVLRHGCSWFEMPILIGEKLEKYRVQILGRPKLDSFTGAPPHYCQATFTVQIERRKLWDCGVMEIFKCLSPGEFTSIATGLHSILEKQMPGITIIPNEEGLWGVTA